MKYKIGSNQYRKKVGRFSLYEKISYVLIVALSAGYFVMGDQKIVSPCPDTGCSVRTVYAGDAYDPQTIKEKLAVASVRTFGTGHTDALHKLVFKESSFSNYAINPVSKSCGLFQAYPCQKMKCSLSDVDCQIAWGMEYIKRRYSTPSKAWEFWSSHGWY
jgi:hypothetical protein